MEKRTCLCGTVFEFEHRKGNTPKLCPACKAERRRQSRQAWVDKNYDRQLELNREGAKRRRAERAPERIAPLYTKAQTKRRNRIRSYGITPEDHALLWTAQAETCALCRSSEPRARNWHIDHDHVTGKVRGILCGPCNTGIGHLMDDPDLLIAAATYVRRHRDAPPR